MGSNEKRTLVRDEITSGFMDELPNPTKIDLNSLISGKFTNISEIYSSRTGPSRLYCGERYGRRYILKTLKEEYANIPFYQIAMIKEFEIAVSLDHPNIVKTIGMEEVAGIGKAIIMEYVDGTTLDYFLAKTDINRQTGRRLASQIADALQYAHRKQIIHRDIKPQNILITHSGRNVKIIDFGLSDSEYFTMIKVSSGTRQYMAPEQLEPHALPDATADIYSFGIVIRDIAKLTSDTRLMKIAKKCSAVKKEKRFQSFDEIVIPQGILSENIIERLFSSKAMTIILSILIGIFAIVIAYFSYTRFFQR